MMDMYYHPAGLQGGMFPSPPLQHPVPPHPPHCPTQAHLFPTDYSVAKSPTPFGVQDILGMPQQGGRGNKVPRVHIAKRYDGNRNSSFGAAFVSEDEYDKIVATADVLDEVTAHRLGLEYEATIPIGPLRRHRKERKARTVFTNDQLKLLEHRFKTQPRLTSIEREELADQIHLSPTQIRVWFQNKRAKMKRDKLQKDDEPGHHGHGVPHPYRNSII